MNKPIPIVLLIALLFFSFTTRHKATSAAGIINDPNVQITDAGLGWDANADSPQIAAVGHTVYATWIDDRRISGRSEVYLARSADGGTTWSSNVRVSDPNYDSDAADPAIAVHPDGSVWVIWYLHRFEGTNQTNDIRLARSTDGGQTFARTTLIEGQFDPQSPNNPADLREPQLAVDQTTGRIYVLAHALDDVPGDEGFDLILVSFDGELANGRVVALNDAPRTGRTTSAFGPRMSLEAYDGTVCAAWEDKRDGFAIYGTCSTDDGQTFKANSVFSSANAIFPKIALTPDGTLTVAYIDDGDPRRNIQLQRSMNHGSTWNAPRPVTNVGSGRNVSYWDLAVDTNGQLILPWVRVDGSKSDLFLSTSLDGGQNFTAVQVEDEQGQYPTAAAQRDVAVATGGTENEPLAYLVWEDDRNSTREIWAARANLDGSPPTAPTNFRAAPADGAIRLWWTASSDESGIEGYRVYRATGSGGPYTEITPMLVNDTSFVDVELNHTDYFYRVAAVDNRGTTGPRSAEIQARARLRGTDLPFYGTIAYEIGAQIRIREFANFGAELTVANGFKPQFSSDGARLYYYDGAAVRTMVADNTTTFVQNDHLIDYDIAGDGKHFASSNYRQFVSPGGPGGLCGVAEPHFGTAGQMSNLNQFSQSAEVALSADRRWLVYRNEGFCHGGGFGIFEPPHVCVVDLVHHTQGCVIGADFHNPDFAPEEHTFVFAAALTGQNEIWSAAVAEDGSLTNYKQLTSGPANQPSREPSWSTDGQWIVFQRDVDAGPGETWRLFAVKADGTTLRSLDVTGKAPVWSGGGQVSPGNLLERVYLPLIQR
ncbi:MAG: exo-alpha-sialidase [Ardenticatenaceae bacterium]|nr:exo-alpha-sialidase [Ardenticatenaceae bacterium]